MGPIGRLNRWARQELKVKRSLVQGLLSAKVRVVDKVDLWVEYWVEFRRLDLSGWGHPMEEFVTYLADALQQPDAQIQPSDKLRELPNWDSLAVLTTLAMIDEQYGVSLSGAELQSCESVEQLFAKVEASR